MHFTVLCKILILLILSGINDCLLFCKLLTSKASGPCSGQLSEHGGHATEPNKIVPVNPKVYHPHLGLARVYRILGESKLAEEYYKNVIKMSPEVTFAFKIC